MKNKILPYTIMSNKTETGKSVEVNLYGEVVETVPIDWWTGEKIEGLFIELKQFLADLDGLKDAEEVTFRINSVGGDVQAGISIYNRIRELSGKTTTIVDGLAASAASIIAQAGDVRRIGSGAQVMIHGASAGMVGYYNLSALKKIEDGLASTNDSIAAIYAERTGGSITHIKNMMDKERWMTAEEAMAEGFADETAAGALPVVDSVEGCGNMIAVNGVPHIFRGIPLPDMPATGKIARAQMEIANGRVPSAIEQTTSTPEEGRKKTMDLQELKTNHPELVDQIREEAAQAARAEAESAVQAALDADRKRMMEIDSIAQMVGDPALVEKAKYEEPMQAAELALKAMQAQQAAGSSYLAARAAETTPANSVTGSPNAGMEDTVGKDEEELNNLINRLKKEGK